MGLLDWIKDERNRRQAAAKGEEISTRCTPSYDKHEWKQGRQAGNEGVPEAKSATAKTPPKRERAKGHDVSF
jgi:hypothetical protein